MQSIYGFNYSGAEIINASERGSLSVWFQTDTGKVEKCFRANKIEVIRELYKQCISMRNVVDYEIN
mgnify:CR=1 FL=1